MDDSGILAFGLPHI